MWKGGPLQGVPNRVCVCEQKKDGDRPHWSHLCFICTFYADWKGSWCTDTFFLASTILLPDLPAKEVLPQSAPASTSFGCFGIFLYHDETWELSAITYSTCFAFFLGRRHIFPPSPSGLTCICGSFFFSALFKHKVSSLNESIKCLQTSCPSEDGVLKGYLFCLSKCLNGDNFQQKSPHRDQNVASEDNYAVNSCAANAKKVVTD